MLTNLELLLLRLTEQIPHVLVVYFEHADFDFKGTISVLALLDLLEYSVADDWNDAFVSAVADHRIAFARAGLSVGEQTAVVALPISYYRYHALTRMLDPISSYTLF